MKRIKFAHKDVPALAWLHTHSENLEYYHGIQTISYDVFKKDSGMPALMSYVSYVAQSKARDEIVNNVTHEIASQKMKIQGILDFITNIEALINADDEKIGTISAIINNYTYAVKDILSPDFKQNQLDKLGNSSLLKSFGGNYEVFISHQRKALSPICERKAIADTVYSAVVDNIWTKVQKNKQRISGWEINNLFGTSDFREIVKKVACQKVEQATQNTQGQMSKINREVKQIIDNRQELLRQESDNCHEQLVKEHINIELPGLPEFEFATEMTSPSFYTLDIYDVDLNLFVKLSSVFEKKLSNKLLKFCGIVYSPIYKLVDVVFGTDIVDAVFDNEIYDYQFSGSKEQFLKICKENLMDSIKNAVYENGIAEKIHNNLVYYVVDRYMTSLVEELNQAFDSMNNTYMSCVERFRSAVDDRDKYKSEIKLYNLRKENIMSISKCTKKFMDTWGIIIRDFIEDEETEKIPALV